MAEFLLGSEETNPVELKTGLLDAPVLAVARAGGDVIGMAAIKQPTDEYREWCERCSGIRPLPTLELGWVRVHPDHQRQGVATSLIQICLNTINQSVFATAQFKAPIGKINRALGLRTAGGTWQSERRPAVRLQLWLYDEPGIKGGGTSTGGAASGAAGGRGHE